MSEEQGQAQEQPDLNVLATEAASRILASDEPKEQEAPPPQEEAPPTEEATIELDPDAKLFEVEEMREGGIKEKVKYSLSELKAQRMMQADYQRKTAELARMREEAQIQVKQQVEPLVKQYQERLQTYEAAVWQALAPEVQGVNLDQLARENPAEWAAKMQRIQSLQTTLQAIEFEKTKLAESQRQQLQEAQMQQIQKARETLQNEIPGWNDEVYRSVLKTGLEYGYSAPEVNAVTDPRAIKVLHDAMKYRALQTAKPQVEKKVVSVPKVVKPGSTEKVDPNREELQKAKAQLKKTGRTEDAVAVARHFFS